MYKEDWHKNSHTLRHKNFKTKNKNPIVICERKSTPNGFYITKIDEFLNMTNCLSFFAQKP